MKSGSDPHSPQRQTPHYTHSDPALLLHRAPNNTTETSTEPHSPQTGTPDKPTVSPNRNLPHTHTDLAQGPSQRPTPTPDRDLPLTYTNSAPESPTDSQRPCPGTLKPHTETSVRPTLTHTETPLTSLGNLPQIHPDSTQGSNTDSH